MQGSSLPFELRQLYEAAGLRSFVYASIGPATAPLGALLLGSCRPQAFGDDWWGAARGARGGRRRGSRAILGRG
jgi:hypothetical protein